MTRELRVVIADDHPATRAGVRAALESKTWSVVADVPDAAQAVAAAQRHLPDVCLLDINMPGGGIWAAAEITRSVPDAVVVMLTASRDDEDLFSALRAGASGYLLKDMDPNRLGDALHGVLSGEAALPRALVLKIVQQFRAKPERRRILAPRASPETLTPREAEVLDLMSQGLSTEDMAGRLFVSPVTVRTHVSAILRKLRVTDREGAVRLLRNERR